MMSFTVRNARRPGKTILAPWIQAVALFFVTLNGPVCADLPRTGPGQRQYVSPGHLPAQPVLRKSAEGTVTDQRFAKDFIRIPDPVPTVAASRESNAELLRSAPLSARNILDTAPPRAPPVPSQAT